MRGSSVEVGADAVLCKVGRTNVLLQVNVTRRIREISAVKE